MFFVTAIESFLVFSAGFREIGTGSAAVPAAAAQENKKPGNSWARPAGRRRFQCRPGNS